MGTTQSQSQSQNSEIENGNEVEVVKLPYNCNTILREADSSSPADLQQLYHQLCDGVYLNHKKKKYWVEKKSNTNCFLLFARDLLITWDDDHRFWHWYCPSNEMIEVSELLNICWLEIHGNFDTRNLSPNILYEAAFMVMLKDPAYGWEVPVNLRLTLPNGTKQQHKQNLAEKPRGQWIEIPAGDFFTSPENVGPMEISLYEYEGGKWKRGLVIKGIIIRPKNYALNIDP